jgi:hypothetical protein
VPADGAPTFGTIQKSPRGRVTGLDILRDLMLGGRHSRTTVARAAKVSLPTADRWLMALRQKVPGMHAVRVSKTTWVEWRNVGSRPRV